MADEARVVIDIDADASGVTKGVGDAKGALGGLGGTASSMTGTMLKLGSAVGGAFALKEGVSYLKDAAAAGAAEREQMDLLSDSLVRNAGLQAENYDEVEAWIGQIQNATAVGDGELRPALMKLANATGDYSEAQDLLAVALDVSASRGESLDTVIKAMEKGVAGQTSGFSRMGVNVRDAEGQMLSFQQVVESLNQTYGGSASIAATTYAGQVERIKLAMGDAKEMVGQAMQPALEKFAAFIYERMPQIQIIFEKMGEAVGKALGWIADTILPMIGDAFDAFTSNTEEGGSTIGGVFARIGQVVMGLHEIFTAAWPIILEVVKMFVDWLAGPSGQALIETLLTAIGVILEALKTVFEAIWPVIQQAVSMFVDFLAGPAGTALIETLLSLVITAVNTVAEVFSNVFPALMPIVKTFIDFLGREEVQYLLVTVFELVADLVNKLLPVFSDVFGALAPIIENFAPLIEIALKPIIWAVEAVTASIDALRDAYNWLTGAAAKEQAKKHGDAALARILEQGWNPADYGYEMKDGEWVSAYQHGGIVLQEQFAKLGEGNRAELVLPLTDPNRTQSLLGAVGLAPDYSELQDLLANATGGTNYIFTGDITVVANDPQDFMKKMEAEVGIVTRAKGGRV